MEAKYYVTINNCKLSPKTYEGWEERVRAIYLAFFVGAPDYTVRVYDTATNTAQMGYTHTFAALHHALEKASELHNMVSAMN